MPNQPAADTAVRTVRVPLTAWDQARSIADSVGDSVSAVLNRALLDYIANPPTAPIADDALPCTVCGRAVKLSGGGGVYAARHKNPEGQWCAA